MLIKRGTRIPLKHLMPKTHWDHQFLDLYRWIPSAPWTVYNGSKLFVNCLHCANPINTESNIQRNVIHSKFHCEPCLKIYIELLTTSGAYLNQKGFKKIISPEIFEAIYSVKNEKNFD